MEFLAQLSNKLEIPKTAPSQDTVGTILNIVFTIATLLSLLFIVIGAFKYVISAGDPSSTASAKNTVLYAVIGLVVTLSAFTILNFVLSRI